MKKTMRESIREAMAEEMRRDPSVYLFGEDIGQYGGTLKVTDGLWAEFGDERVIDTPISENVIVGASVGAALMGMRPVAELMFGDFLLKETPSEGNPGDGKRSQEVPEGFTRGCVIRTRQPGDRIRPFGSAGSRKLQDYLTDRKIPEPYRNRIPLLCRDDEVLLVCGVGAGNIPRLDGRTPSVRLTWHGDMPWME